MVRKTLWLVMACVAGVAGCVAEVDSGDEGAVRETPEEGAGVDVGELGLAPIKAGDVLDYSAETPHPYATGWKHEVVSEGASFVRVHLAGLDLAPGDYVTVSGPDGSQSSRYEGRGPNGDGDVWAFAVDGDAAIVELHVASAGGAHGFRIDSIGHGTLDLRAPDAAYQKQSPTPEVICGDDGKEDAACHPELDALQRPVARLLYTSGGGQYLCTGWLVSGASDSTMLTNNHCFSTQTEVNTLEARFNYQRTSCGGSTSAAPTSYSGGTFLKTSTEARKGKSGGLDYTLITLQGSPEATWGELIPTTKAAAAGQQILFIQHPGGKPKQIGYWEDAAHSTRCAVAAVDQTYGQSASASQTAYGCDSEGGSSGSPILDASTGRVIALHHYGNVETGTCLNSGTEMSAVCADAGSLLNCVNN